MSIFADSKMGFPLSSVSTRPNSSARASSMSAARIRMRPRSRGFIEAHAPDSKAPRAAFTARSRSSRPASAISASGSPVAGFVVENRLPEAAGTNSPPMKRSVLSSCATGVSVASLLSLELRDPLLLVRGDPFLRILALEEELLELPLHGEGRLHREVPARLHGPLDAAH